MAKIDVKFMQMDRATAKQLGSTYTEKKSAKATKTTKTTAKAKKK